MTPWRISYRGRCKGGSSDDGIQTRPGGQGMKSSGRDGKRYVQLTTFEDLVRHVVEIDLELAQDILDLCASVCACASARQRDIRFPRVQAYRSRRARGGATHKDHELVWAGDIRDGTVQGGTGGSRCECASGEGLVECARATLARVGSRRFRAARAAAAGGSGGTLKGSP